MTSRIGLMVLAVFLILQTPVLAQDLPIDQQLPPVASPTHRVAVGELPILDTRPAFDPVAAATQWLARVKPEAREAADAYADSGHLLRIVDLVYGLGIAALLLWLQISARIRDWAEEQTHSRAYQAMLYGVILVTAVTLMSLPLAIYQGYFREQAYGFSSQSFLQWAEDFAILFTVTLVAAVIFLPLFYAVIRAAREAWWLFGAGLAIAFLVMTLAIYPVAIMPLFSHAAPLPDTPLKQQILSLARANGVPADAFSVTEDSSRRISAAVTGFLGTTRISLNDNLLRQGTPDEVLAMVGHEMGHYVMGHTTRLVLLFGLLVLAGFGFTALAFQQATGLFGGNWQVRRPDDVAGFPLLVALLGLFLFLAMPVTNAMSRATEREADIFGVNAVRKPDAVASLALKLSDDRKLAPGLLEGAIFFDRPSAKDSIAMMMQWKAEHVRDWDVRDTVRDNPH